MALHLELGPDPGQQLFRVARYSESTAVLNSMMITLAQFCPDPQNLSRGFFVVATTFLLMWWPKYPALDSCCLIQPLCDNHDDGETEALILCDRCGNLCGECDRVLHYSKKNKDHQRQVCRSSYSEL